MIQGYEDLTPDALHLCGFDDPARACHLLQDMAGHDVPDAVFDAALRPLVLALSACADPDRAVANVARWADSVPSRVAAYALLGTHPPAAQLLITIMAASQFFADLLIHSPETLETLTNTRLRRAPRPPEMQYAEMAKRVLLPSLPNARRDALRRVKGPLLLRIGVRDLLGEADFAQTVADISAFADTCVRLAWEICRAEHAGFTGELAVLALGKLGGQELNYSSDIDLIFVHSDSTDAKAAAKMGECVQSTLAKQTGAGFVFRVDLRLRPEGRFGPVSRSLAACRAYYEAWAEPWERQALMKARCVAGDAALGAAFVAMTQDFVYPPRTDAAFVDSIRANKRRLERKIVATGDAARNVKEGIGGIRDVEFAVQLMTLVAGGARPEVRSGNTLASLVRLMQAALLSPAEAETLRDGYIFLRTVEHRLQLLDEQAVRVLPQEGGARRKLARRMGYADLASFDRDYLRHTQQVHALFRWLFYNAPADALAGSAAREGVSVWALSPDDATALSHLANVLASDGFQDVPAALGLIKRAVQGSEYGGVQGDARAAFARLLPPLLEAAAQTQDPDGALRGLEALADTMPSRAAWLEVLGNAPRLLPRLARLAGDAPTLWRILETHPQWLDRAADEPLMDSPYPFASPLSLSAEQMATDALRARLHTGARDIWGLASVEETLAQTTRVAQTLVHAALALASAEAQSNAPFAIIALGKAGGAEMAYSSDVDVLYVAAPHAVADAARVAARAQQILRTEMARSGVVLEMDARLRPHGRDGALVLDLDTYAAYYAQSPTWERQMLCKARAFAGDEALGKAFVALAHSVTYAAPATDTMVDDMRAMKQRWERERARGPQDIKLGPGGLSDIEWTCQLLQMRHGSMRPRLRAAGTLPALRALRDDALLTQADWETLSGAYETLAALRNHAALRAVPSLAPTDTLTTVQQAVRAVCLRLFFGTSEEGK